MMSHIHFFPSRFIDFEIFISFAKMDTTSVLARLSPPSQGAAQSVSCRIFNPRRSYVSQQIPLLRICVFGSEEATARRQPDQDGGRRELFPAVVGEPASPTAPF